MSKLTRLALTVLLLVVTLAATSQAQTNTPTLTPTITLTPTKTVTPGAGSSILTQGRAVVGNLATTSGGVMIQAQRQAVTWTDTTAVTLFTLPADAVPIDIKVDVPTGFTDSGTDLLDIGITGTGNYFVNDLDIAATGRKAPTLTNLGVSVGSSPVDVTATYIPQNSNAAAGRAIVTVLYLVP